MYTAIIVEPRKHPALEFVLTNFLENLNDDWNIIIYNGRNNIEYVNNILNNPLKEYLYRIRTVTLDVENLTLQDYNNLMTDKDFVNSIPTEIFLIFQTDTIICKEQKDLIYDFLEYDYVGAPWNENKTADDYVGPPVANGVGNGGLSLRRKTKMLEIIDKCPYVNRQDNRLPEDVYFAIGCNNIIINKPSIEKAKLFSMEMLKSEKSFGVHKTWGFFDYSLEPQCKTYDTLYNLNNIVPKEGFEQKKLEENNLDNMKKLLKVILIIIILIIIIRINTKRKR